MLLSLPAELITEIVLHIARSQEQERSRTLARLSLVHPILLPSVRRASFLYLRIDSEHRYRSFVRTVESSPSCAEYASHAHSLWFSGGLTCIALSTGLCTLLPLCPALQSLTLHHMMIDMRDVALKDLVRLDLISSTFALEKGGWTLPALRRLTLHNLRFFRPDLDDDSAEEEDEEDEDEDDDDDDDDDWKPDFFSFNPTSLPSLRSISLAQADSDLIDEEMDEVMFDWNVLSCLAPQLEEMEFKRFELEEMMSFITLSSPCLTSLHCSFSSYQGPTPAKFLSFLRTCNLVDLSIVFAEISMVVHIDGDNGHDDATKAGEERVEIAQAILHMINRDSKVARLSIYVAKWIGDSQENARNLIPAVHRTGEFIKVVEDWRSMEGAMMESCRTKSIAFFSGDPGAPNYPADPHLAMMWRNGCRCV